MDAQICQDVLKHMFTTGEWSDLTIIAGGREFKVHRSVVCRGSPFLQAACSRDWQEARTGIVRLPEDEKTVHQLLSHLYGADLKRPSEYSEVQRLLAARVTADKHSMESFLQKSEACLITAIHDRNALDWNVHNLVDLGVQLYAMDQPRVATQDMLFAIVEETADWTSHIHGDCSAWTKVVSSTRYIYDLTRFLGQWYWRSGGERIVKVTEANGDPFVVTASTSEGVCNVVQRAGRCGCCLK